MTVFLRCLLCIVLLSRYIYLLPCCSYCYLVIPLPVYKQQKVPITFNSFLYVMKHVYLLSSVYYPSPPLKPTHAPPPPIPPPQPTTTQPHHLISYLYKWTERKGNEMKTGLILFSFPLHECPGMRRIVGTYVCPTRNIVTPILVFFQVGYLRVLPLHFFTNQPLPT
jgi:hypothetical protein